MAERYKFPVDRLVNRLIPHFLCGRRYILLVQSMLHPLQSLADRFVALAREKHIEARMTSQVIYFEWYLNHKFSRYFANPADRIRLEDSTPLGVDLYHEGALGARPFTVWYEGEPVVVADPAEEPRAMYLLAEEKAINRVSFMVCVPHTTIPQPQMAGMIAYAVDTYRTAGKTYLIRMDGTEDNSNQTNE